MTDWAAVLDSVEEHLRRVELVIAGELDEAPAPELPAGDLPAEYADRLAYLIQRNHQVEAAAIRRRNELDRAMAYSAK